MNASGRVARYAVAVRVEEIAPDYLPQRGDRLLILGPPAGIAALRETR